MKYVGTVPGISRRKISLTPLVAKLKRETWMEIDSKELALLLGRKRLSNGSLRMAVKRLPQKVVCTLRGNGQKGHYMAYLRLY